MRVPPLPVLAAALILSGCTQTMSAASPAGRSAIDYAAGGGIRDWHAEDANGIFIRDSANNWHYARFTGPCPGVVREQQIAFEPDPLGRFDELSRVRTQTETCAVASIQASQPPAAKGGPKG